MKRFFLTLLLVAVCVRYAPCIAQAAVCNLQHKVAVVTAAIIKTNMVYPQPETVAYYGRWEKTQSGTMRTGRGATYLRTGFTGTHIGVRLQDNKNIWWRVSIDDGPWQRFQAQSGETVLADALSIGKHELFLVRDTEGTAGVSTLHGFVLAEGARLVPACEQQQRRIEFVGDSILAGAFAQGPGPYLQQEDGYMSFGPQLARALSAEWSVVATSGEGVVVNMSETGDRLGIHALDDYERLAYGEGLESGRQSDFKPQLIVVNHGANDFEAKQPPTATEFTNGYRGLIRGIRVRNPQAVIICLDPVPFDSSNAAKNLIATAVEELRIAGDENVHFLPVNGLTPVLDATDLADGEHPLISGHTRLATLLQPKIAAIMQWS